MATKTTLTLMLILLVTLAGCVPAVTPTPAPQSLPQAPASPPTESVPAADESTSATPAARVAAPIVVQAEATAVPATLPPATLEPEPSPTVGPLTPRVKTVLGGLRVPWALEWDAEGNLYYTERPGSLSVLRVGATQPELLANLQVAQSGEGGLLGLALHPAFGQNGWLYLMYTTASNPAINRIARYTLSNGALSEETILLDNIPGARNHDGGRLSIGPDGRLYATTGDAGNRPLAQDPASLAGKILRLNLDGTVPADNPTPGSYVFSLGHRNPQGLAWQPGTGILWSTEHGPSGENGQCCQDELNRIVPGGNYGWPVVTTGSDDARFVHPVLHSGVASTWAPGGLAFYDGAPLALWQGNAFIPGLRGQVLLRVTLGGAAMDEVVNVERLYEGQFGRLREVRVGPDGYLYFTTSNRDGRGAPAPEDDRILRIVPD
jgi:glucose/arabinose dehydrogenase